MKADDLIGKWKIEREVFDPQGEIKQCMRGFGYFHHLKNHELLYQEQLWHETETRDLFFATKSYRYVFKKKEIQIYFHQEEDDRLFMTLPIGKKMSGNSICKEDHYRLQWDWIHSDIFLMRYTVQGTKKNYMIESEYRNLSFGVISPVLRDFSQSSQSFYLEKGALALPFGKNLKNLREHSSDNEQNKPETQVK